MIIVGQCLLDMGNCRIFTPAELIGKGLPVSRAGGRPAIQLVAGADVLVVHGDFIVMRQRAAGITSIPVMTFGR